MSKVIELTESNHAEVLKEGKVFVQVWSDKCGWCDKQKPVSEKVVEELGVKFASINLNYYDTNPSEFRRLYMENKAKAPVLLVFQDGGLVGRSYKALLSESVLKKFIESPTIDTAEKQTGTAPSLDYMKARAFDLFRAKEQIEAQLRQVVTDIQKAEGQNA